MLSGSGVRESWILGFRVQAFFFVVLGGSVSRRASEATAVRV